MPKNSQIYNNLKLFAQFEIEQDQIKDIKGYK